MSLASYSKWDNFRDSDDDSDAEDPFERPAPTKPPPSAAAVEGAQNLVERLTRVELLGEEVLTERAQVVELDRKRNQNREALAALRQLEKEGSFSSSQGRWMCMGEHFVQRRAVPLAAQAPPPPRPALPRPTQRRRCCRRRSHGSIQELLRADQRRLDDEINALREGIKRKASQLCELDPSM